MKKAWTDEAWEDYLYWQTEDRKTLKRINLLLKDIDRNGTDGIGKPEPLTGDHSDNIRGVEKIGPKTAASLIRQFGSLQAAIGRADEIAKPYIRESVKKNAERLLINYQLIKLDDRAAIPFALEELKYTYDGVMTMAVLERIGLR